MTVESGREKIENERHISTAVITRNYVVALVLIAVLSLMASILLGSIVNTQETSGAAINISGRQRMLSQRIALLSLRLALSSDEATSRRLKSELKNAVSLMERTHEMLLEGGPRHSLPEPSRQVRAIYVDPPVRLDKQVRQYLVRARKVAQTPVAELDPQDPNVQYLLRVSESRLLSGLDEVVAQYELESDTTIFRLQVTISVVLAVILIVLVVEALLIFNPMVKQIEEEAGELEHSLEQEHRIAAKLQKSLAPRDIPKIEGLEIKLRYQSATRAAEVGGDFYDFFELSEGRWGIVMGDVEGHGVAAAAETARVKYLLRDRAHTADTLPDVFASLNEALVAQDPERFTALTYIVYDPAAAALTLINAANPYPYLSRIGGFLETTGVPLGILPDQEYESVDLTLKTGDLLLLFTDGLVEARRGRELFERERIEQFVSGHAADALDKMLPGLVARAQDFAGGRLMDDILVIAIRKK